MKNNYQNFDYFNDAVFVINDNEEIVYLNSQAKLFFNKDLNKDIHINSIAHLFTFDACILDEKDYTFYTPLLAAINSKESFFCNATFRINENEYKNYSIKSYDDNKNRVIIATDDTANLNLNNLKDENKSLKDKVNQLEQANTEIAELKSLSESLASRTILVNKIAKSIKDSLNIDEIIKNASTEIQSVLGVSTVAFIDYINNEFKLKHTNIKELDINNETMQAALKELKQTNSTITAPYFDSKCNTLKSRIMTPVAHANNLQGVILLLHIDNKRIWLNDEITLIENIASLLATGINQINLFNELKYQKQELQSALTKLKDTQTQLVQSEKMASLGQLVAGVAHEINTPLGSINSNNDMIAKCIDKLKTTNNPKELLNILENINNTDKEAIYRVNEIVKALKNFARLDEAELQKADIHKGILSTISLIQHEVKNKIDIITEFGEIPEINCYPNLLNQVFMNLLVNAYQSIKDTGTITITTVKSIKGVNITIADTGSGIEQNHLDKIFDPGFTTKGVGVGTGLGLPICFQIIEKHKGNIKVQSEIGKGTSFSVFIPSNL